ncbi:MAG: hypothetical protein WBP34_09545 [Thermoanaerobaculia bacterium]
MQSKPDNAAPDNAAKGPSAVGSAARGFALSEGVLRLVEINPAVGGWHKPPSRAAHYASC